VSATNSPATARAADGETVRSAWPHCSRARRAGVAGGARLERLGPDGAGREPARSTIRTADGTHLPPLDFLELEFDKHTGVNTEGLAVCTIARLENTLTTQAKQLCPDAIIGSGQAGAEIAFPEQEPFLAKAPLVIFNGPPKNGHPVFIFHVYAHVPAPTTFITTAEIGKATGL
jgi:hypothetical protein